MSAQAGATATVQMTVRGGPSGDVVYHQIYRGDDVLMAPGEADNPDLRGVIDYPAAVAAAKGELDHQAAMASGQVTFEGDLGRIAPLGAAVARVQQIEQLLDVEYDAAP
jgi:hypothetical protein